MIRYRAGFAPIATEGDKVPTAIHPTPAVEEAKVQTEVLDYTRKASGQQPLLHNLRQDGPTMEMWTAAGYLPEHYPPAGYAELDSQALREYKAWVASQATSNGEHDKPHSVNDKPNVE